MNVNLYHPNGEHDDNNNITFIISHKTNAAIVYLFKLDIIAAAAAGHKHPTAVYTTATLKTRLVSGYENGRPISMALRSIAPPLCDTREARGAYVISCIRAPHLYRELFTYNKYTTPLGVVVVRTDAELQVWHLLSVRKTFEAKGTRNIAGLRVHVDCGADIYYPKDLIIMSGNVSVHFLNNLQKCRAHHKDIDAIKYLCADLKIDNSPVELERTPTRCNIVGDCRSQ
ncbi:ORF-12 [Catopsilia pomona nucleopolyhedrovirus]|uniref:ORF-12 n=1 Tax=Catopsilia pomona nucleopolyhedrovirus TaxID=1850906 RepID=A0A172WZ89_9ABAC|nr:ORF-12 [Catopsilia pomona nucleopolyhedrovirus]ANF29660.1 ORF-12 [Catopsilia pomona nucleopolyhedrovirus]